MSSARAPLAVTRCLLAAALFGASAPAASVLVGDLPTLALAGLLYLGAAAVAAPSVLRSPPSRIDLRAGWRPLAAAILAGGALGPALLVAGLARIDAASASILLNLELVATVLLAATVFREHLGHRVIAGAAAVTAAGMIVAWAPGATVNSGAVLVAAACACWGIDNCVTARIEQLTPEAVVVAKGIVAGTVNLTLGVIMGQSTTALAPGPVALALLVGALGYGLSITWWVKGARDLGAARAQVIFAAGPFIGVAIAWLTLADRPSSRSIAALVLAAAGVALSMRSDHEHRHHHDPTSHAHEHVHPDAHHVHLHDAGADRFIGRHAHAHEHADVLVHSHRHLPDLHHHHDHP